MGVSIETVGIQLHLMASVFRRKISTDMVTTYHAILDRHVREESQFVAACVFVLENEAAFPAPSLLLRLSREASRNRSEIGEPWIKGPDGEPVASVREWKDELQAGRSPNWPGYWSHAIERPIYEEAVRMAGGGPGPNEGSWSFVARVAKLVADDLQKAGLPQPQPAVDHGRGRGALRPVRPPSDAANGAR